MELISEVKIHLKRLIDNAIENVQLYSSDEFEKWLIRINELHENKITINTDKEIIEFKTNLLHEIISNETDALRKELYKKIKTIETIDDLDCIDQFKLHLFNELQLSKTIQLEDYFENFNDYK